MEAEKEIIDYYKNILGEHLFIRKIKIDIDFDEVIKDFDDFYDISYFERLMLTKKYKINTFHSIIDREKRSLYYCEFKKSIKKGGLWEICKFDNWFYENQKWPTKKIKFFSFLPQTEHERRNLVVYDKPYFEENEEKIFFEWIYNFNHENGKYFTDCEYFINEYWLQMGRDNFPTEYLNIEFENVRNLIENTEKNKFFNSEFIDAFKFGSEKYRRGEEFPFDNYLPLLNKYWENNYLGYFQDRGDFFSRLFFGYQITKFYKFLLLQKSRLENGEDISKPETNNSILEKGKPFTAFQIAIINKVREQTGIIKSWDIIKETETQYFERVLKDFDNFKPISYRNYYYELEGLYIGQSEKITQKSYKSKNPDRAKEYFENDTISTQKCENIINKIQQRIIKK